MATEVIMPGLGESVFEGKIARWLKQEGDPVEPYEPLLEIETDKVTTEATVEVAGTLLKILFPDGESVPVGTVIAFVGEPGESITGQAAMETAEAGGPPALKPARAARPISPPASNGGSQAQSQPYHGRISPVVGRIAEEHQVDLNLVRGTGRDGRITKNDILAYVQEQERQVSPIAAVAAVSSVAPTTAPRAPAADQVADELLPLTSMRRAIAEHMVRSKATSPHVTTVFDLEFSAVFAHRAANKDAFAQKGVNLTYTAYLITAVVQALRAHPLANSSWSDQGIILKKAIHVGMATAIPGGLIVPVIKDADGLSLMGLAKAINDLAERARNNQLAPDEVQGGTFTLTNHGVSGSLFATPIINQPQCAILGVGKIEKRVKVIDEAIAIRPMAYASLTFDHRILDGATADAFMSTFKDNLESWR